jgi:HlyD family secretion protein
VARATATPRGVKELQAQRRWPAQAARSDEIAAAAAEARGAAGRPGLGTLARRPEAAQRAHRCPVFDVMYRAGEWVPAGAPVVALLPPGALKLRFFVPQPALPRVADRRRRWRSCDGCPAGLTARCAGCRRRPSSRRR